MWLAAALAARRAAAVDETITLRVAPEDDGACEEWPASVADASNNFCGSLIGTSVYVFKSSGSLEEQFRALVGKTASLMTLANTVASPACLDEFITIICNSWFPACDKATQLPRLPCASGCDKLQTAPFCLNAFELAASAGLSNRIVTCSRMIGDAAQVADYTMPNFYASWQGTPMFRPATYAESINGVEATLQCVPLHADGGEAAAGGGGAGPAAPRKCPPRHCKEPMQKRRIPAYSQSTVTLNRPELWDYCNTTDDCDLCMENCFFGCPYQHIYDEAEYSSMWTLNWLPGVVALPLAALVLYSEAAKLARQKRKNVTDYYILFAAALCIVHVVVDSLPSLVLGSDLRCDGIDTMIAYRNGKGHAMQLVGQLKVNVMQSLMFVVAFTLWKVRQQLVASKSMSKYNPSAAIRALAVLCIFVVPALSALLCYALSADYRYEQNRCVRGKLAACSRPAFTD